MKYKIVTSGKTKVITIGEISRNLKVSSEVYALLDSEIYLGMISHKTLVFFSVEFAEYAIKNYTRDRVPEADLCISLIRKWISGDTSVSNEDLRAAANATSHTAAATSHTAAAAIYSANAAANAANANSGSAAFDANANAVYAAYYASDAAGKDKDKEFIRQGEFILDFLKSGKNLFLV